MAHLTPVSRHELIQRLRQLGFEGPYTSGREVCMLRGDQRLINPHRNEISVDLLRRILTQGEIPRERWLKQ